MNAVVTEEKQENLAKINSPGPGEKLKEARLALNMSVKDLAQKIHLTRDMVEAIECDDYSEMPARVFVRGYIRNYVRTIGLPSQELVARFDEIWPEDNAPITTVTNTEPRLASDLHPKTSRWSKLLTWVLFLIGMAFVIIWTQGHFDKFLVTLETKTKESVSLSEENLLGASLSNSRVNLVESATTKEAIVENAAETAISKASTTEVISLEPDEEVETVIGSNYLALPVANTQSVEFEANHEEQPRAESVTSNDQNRAEDIAIDSGSYVSFKENSWVDIRDSQRSFKIFGEMKQGTRRLLSGTAPYKVVLGNASGVSIVLEGKTFDYSTFIKGNVARFTLQ